MKFSRLFLVLSLFVCSACILSAADGYKFDRPIQIVVFQAPGGISDLSARVFADNLSRHIGQNVVVVNTTGAGGSIAAHKVADAPADGTTLLYVEEGTLTNRAAGTLDMDWREFELIAQFGGSEGQFLYTSKNTGITDVESMKKYAEAHGGQVTTAITLGNPTHFQVAAIEKATGVKFRPIDVGTGSDKLAATLTGQVETCPGSLPGMRDYLTNGDVKCIGLLHEMRSDLFPDFKTFAEQGYPLGTPFLKFFMIAAPKGTPKEIIEALDAYTKETVVNDKKTHEAYEKMYMQPVYRSAKECAELLEQLEPNYFALAKEMGLR